MGGGGSGGWGALASLHRGHLRRVNGQHSPAQNREHLPGLQGRRHILGTVRISLAGEPVTNTHAPAERLLFLYFRGEQRPRTAGGSFESHGGGPLSLGVTWPKGLAKQPWRDAAGARAGVSDRAFGASLCVCEACSGGGGGHGVHKATGGHFGPLPPSSSAVPLRSFSRRLRLGISEMAASAPKRQRGEAGASSSSAEWDWGLGESHPWGVQGEQPEPEGIREACVCSSPAARTGMPEPEGPEQGCGPPES